MPPSNRYSGLRWGLAIFSAVVLVITLLFTLYSWATTSISEGIAEIPFNDILSKSIEIRIGLAGNLFQITVIITGALWGVVIAKVDEAETVFALPQEIIMFVCASLILLSSLLSYIIYTYRVSYIYGIAGQIYHKDNPQMGDVFNPIINNFFVYQSWHFGLGCLVALITLISAHILRKG